jgi:hypothetical protein
MFVRSWKDNSDLRLLGAGVKININGSATLVYTSNCKNNYYIFVRMVSPNKINGEKKLRIN